MNEFDFVKLLAQPGWDLMGMARNAWEYGWQDERRGVDPGTGYRVISIGDPLASEDVGIGLARVADLDDAQEAPPAADEWRIASDGSAEICQDSLFDGECAPRVWASANVDAFLCCYDQGSGYPGLSHGLCRRHIPMDPAEGCYAAAAYPEEFELLVCHASLQWFPNHDVLIANLLDMVERNGVFAASIPLFGQGLEFRRPRTWIEGHPGGYSSSFFCLDPPTTFTALDSEGYDALFRGDCRIAEHRIVEANYRWVLRGVHSVEEWCERSGVRHLIDLWSFYSREERMRQGHDLLEEELLKWLHAGNPKPIADGIELRYPFLLIVACVR